MTFDTVCKNWIRTEACHAVYPKTYRKGSSDVVYRDEAGTPFRWPSLPALHEYYVDFSTVIRGSKVQPRYSGDTNYLSNGVAFLTRLSGWIRNVLWNTNASYLVICMDEMGRTPACKKALTAAVRQANLEDLSESWPDENPLQDGEPLPSDINSIWYCWKARCHLFEYITHYLVYRFLGIPEGKTLVVEGGRLPGDSTHTGCTCPLHISSKLVERHERSGVITLDRRIEHIRRSSLDIPFGTGYPPAEGELKLFSHLYSYILHRPHQTQTQVVLQSIDGDTILIALLQAARWRHCLDLYVLGKVSLGSELQPEDVIAGLNADFQRKLAIAQQLGASSEELKKLRAPRKTHTVYSSEYVFVNSLERSIREKVGSIEMFVLMTSLRGNDYVKKLDNVGFSFILQAYQKQRKKIGTPVRVLQPCEKIEPQQRIAYEIDVAALFYLCYHAYRAKNSRSSVWEVCEDFDLEIDSSVKALQKCRGMEENDDDDNAAQQRLLLAEAVYTLMYKRVKAKVEEDYASGKRKTTRGIPTSPDMIWTTAYNLRWFFRYFGNGADPFLHQLSGLETETDGNNAEYSIFGYEKDDDTKDVRLSSNVDKSVCLLQTEVGPPCFYTRFDDCEHCTRGQGACVTATEVRRTAYCLKVKEEMQKAVRRCHTQFSR